MRTFLMFAVVLLVRKAISTPIATVVESGTSAQFRSQDSLGNYEFGYNEEHTSGGTFRREIGNTDGRVAGSYGLQEADGRIRIVNYVADENGFKADVLTNEPGVQFKDTADTSFNNVISALVQTAITPPPIVAVLVHGLKGPSSKRISDTKAESVSFPETESILFSYPWSSPSRPDTGNIQPQQRINPLANTRNRRPISSSSIPSDNSTLSDYESKASISLNGSVDDQGEVYSPIFPMIQAEPVDFAFPEISPILPSNLWSPSPRPNTSARQLQQAETLINIRRKRPVFIFFSNDHKNVLDNESKSLTTSNDTENQQIEDYSPAASPTGTKPINFSFTETALNRANDRWSPSFRPDADIRHLQRQMETPTDIRKPISISTTSDSGTLLRNESKDFTSPNNTEDQELEKDAPISRRIENEPVN